MNKFLLLAAALIGCACAVFEGEFAEKGQFPYQVALTKKGKLHCGGVLVHEQFVLTAARCFFEGDKPVAEKSLRVFFGSERLMMGGQFRNVKQVYVHEDFDHQFKYDLALVELNKPAQLSETVGFATVAEATFNEDGFLTFAGWGRSSEQDNMSYKLKYTELSAYTAEKCKNTLGDAYYEGAVCFHNKESQSGTCFGDYGGPVVGDGTLFGVSSYTFGGECGTENPDVFVDVGFFHDWVQEKVNAEN